MNDQELALKLLVILSRTYKVIMDRAVKDMKKYGLAEKEFAVLELLYHKGRFPLQQIGEKILVSSGGITYTVDKLEAKGYIRRVACPEDRRVIYAEITDEGSSLMKHVFPAHAKFLQTLFTELQTEEKLQLIQLLKKLGYSAQEAK